MSEAIRNRPARPFVYTPLNKAASSHDVEKEAAKNREKGQDTTKDKEKEKEKGATVR